MENAFPALSPLFARSEGNGTRSVMCLHSSTASHGQWRGLATELAKHARVVSVDLHGHGHSPEWPAQAASTLGVDAQGALQALDAAAPEAAGVHLVAHSYGAAVALQIALDHPGLVRSLSLYEPVAFGVLAEMAPTAPALAEIEAIARRVAMLNAAGQLAEAASAFVSYWAGAEAWEQMNADQRDAVQSRITTIPRHFDATFRARWTLGDLRRLGMPTLLINGGRTRASARDVAFLLGAALPNVRRVTIADAGHLGPITHEAPVNAAIVEHLRACEVVPQGSPKPAVA